MKSINFKWKITHSVPTSQVRKQNTRIPAKQEFFVTLIAVIYQALIGLLVLTGPGQNCHIILFKRFVCEACKRSIKISSSQATWCDSISFVDTNHVCLFTNDVWWTLVWNMTEKAKLAKMLTVRNTQRPWCPREESLTSGGPC